MFSHAVSAAAKFTFPVIISHRRYDGSLDSAMAAFVVVNPDGWIVTAAHVLQTLLDAPNHADAIASYETAKAVKGKQRRSLRKDPKWITNFSYFWTFPAAQVQGMSYNPTLDLAVGQLKPFDPAWVTQYPVFKNPSAGLLQGTSLCKLGFPFHSFTPTFDPATNMFTLPPEALPAPRFPNEGILTREAVGPTTPDGFTQKFIETSSPGLRGQSGGPVFDTNAVVWGIQSRTNHLPLGFKAQAVIDGKKIEEQQFLNVGWAVHPETVSAFLAASGIAHTLD